MRLVALALASALVSTPAAVAELITFQFDGVVDTNTFASGPWTFAHPGDEFVIGYTFDTDATDADADPSRGEFAGSISSFAVVAGTAFEIGGSAGIIVGDNAGGLDAYSVNMQLTRGLAAFIELTDPSQTALDTDLLPLDLTLDAWQGRVMRVSTIGGGPEITGTITRFSIIPAPAAGVAFIACLLAPRRRRAFV